jgi:hypothetical protein
VLTTCFLTSFNSLKLVPENPRKRLIYVCRRVERCCRIPLCRRPSKSTPLSLPPQNTGVRFSAISGAVFDGETTSIQTSGARARHGPESSSPTLAERSHAASATFRIIRQFTPPTTIELCLIRTSRKLDCQRHNLQATSRKCSRRIGPTINYSFEPTNEANAKKLRPRSRRPTASRFPRNEASFGQQRPKGAFARLHLIMGRGTMMRSGISFVFSKSFLTYRAYIDR